MHTDGNQIVDAEAGLISVEESGFNQPGQQRYSFPYAGTLSRKAIIVRVAADVRPVLGSERAGRDAICPSRYSAYLSSSGCMPSCDDETNDSEFRAKML